MVINDDLKMDFCSLKKLYCNICHFNFCLINLIEFTNFENDTDQKIIIDLAISLISDIYEVFENIEKFQNFWKNKFCHLLFEASLDILKSQIYPKKIVSRILDCKNIPEQDFIFYMQDLIKTRPLFFHIYDLLLRVYIEIKIAIYQMEFCSMLNDDRHRYTRCSHFHNPVEFILLWPSVCIPLSFIFISRLNSDKIKEVYYFLKWPKITIEKKCQIKFLICKKCYDFFSLKFISDFSGWNKEQNINFFKFYPPNIKLSKLGFKMIS